jgi:hypothetical protein
VLEDGEHGKTKKRWHGKENILSMGRVVGEKGKFLNSQTPEPILISEIYIFLRLDSCADLITVFRTGSGCANFLGLQDPDPYR